MAEDQQALLDGALEHIMDDDIANGFEAWFTEKAAAFSSLVDNRNAGKEVEDCEQKHEWHTLYEEFCALFETCMDAYLTGRGSTPEELEAVCKAALADGEEGANYFSVQIIMVRRAAPNNFLPPSVLIVCR